MLPLVRNNTGVTHILLAAFHLNTDPQRITLNDDPPDSPIYDRLWEEVPVVKRSGIKVMGMLGGAAPGTFRNLDGSEEKFERYYTPLLDLVRRHQLDGLDLDVEEPISQQGIVRLIDRLESDLGQDFIITLAPVATALLGIGKFFLFSFFFLFFFFFFFTFCLLFLFFVFFSFRNILIQ